MLTRLRVSGFKNLVDVDVNFGPFTCIAGANGAGKSNLLDAILFLSALADRPLIDAALSVRDQGAKTGDIRGLFHHSGESFAEEMSFEAEMIVPPEGVDDLGRPAKASATFVNYSLGLRYKQGDGAHSQGGLEIVREELKHITFRDAVHHLQFDHSTQWRRSVIQNTRRTPNFISTGEDESERFIHVHQDGGSSGKPQTLLAARLPRTVLSAANAAETPTATLVKREMQSWRLLQLEPSSLREPDGFTATPQLTADGGHLAATLYRYAHSPEVGEDEDAVYAEVANRLAQLIDDVRRVHVDRDERRQLLTLYATGPDGTQHSARSLSDGTLRFLALTLLSLEVEPRGLICLEEPENGIHPERIPAMIKLLTDLSTDVTEKRQYDKTEGLRQVIINTHSPAVVLQVPDESLLIAVSRTVDRRPGITRGLQLLCLPDTWRNTGNGQRAVLKGQLLAYLNPVSLVENAAWWTDSSAATPLRRKSPRRVVDREDIGQYQFVFEESAR